MQRITCLTAGILLVMLSACTPAPVPIPAATLATASPTAAPASPTAITPTVAATDVPPTATVAPTLTLVPPTVTVSARRPIPPNFPLATFEMTDADGKWTITFSSEGTYETTLKHGVVARGTFFVEGDLMTLHDVSASKSCKAAQGDGVYRWTVEGKSFKLMGIEDKCVPRAATLSGSVWTRQP